MIRYLIAAVILCLSSCVKMPEQESLVMIQIQDRNGLSETISSPDRLVPYLHKDFLASQPYKQVLRIFRFSGETHSILTTYHPNGTLWQLLEAKQMRAHGIFRQWFSSGVKQMEATVVGGMADLSPSAQKSWLFDGVSHVWDESGQLIAEIYYDKGVLSGVSKYYYPSGRIRQEIPYAYDQIDGEVCEYWDRDQLRTKTFYVQGAKQGESVGYRPNGELLWKEEYSTGVLQNGWYSGYSEVVHGEGFRALFDGEQPLELQEIRNGVIEGLIKLFNAKGELTSQFSLKNGKKQGEEIVYFEREKPKLSISWDEGVLHGPVKTWYRNGQLQSEREMVRNKRSGTLISWYRDGSLMLVEEYENDQLEKGSYYRKKSREPISTIVNGSGTAMIYDEDGVFMHKVQYLKGKIVDPD